MPRLSSGNPLWPFLWKPKLCAYTLLGAAVSAIIARSCSSSLLDGAGLFILFLRLFISQKVLCSYLLNLKMGMAGMPYPPIIKCYSLFICKRYGIVTPLISTLISWMAYPLRGLIYPSKVLVRFSSVLMLLKVQLVSSVLSLRL